LYAVGINAQFEAAHRLVGDFGPATRLHGHTYTLEATVYGTTLAADGTLFNVLALQAAVDQLIADLHYRDLDEVPGLAGSNTTVERVAHFCWERIAAALVDQPLHELRVQIWENPRVFAAYQAALPKE
jgi:6-pyruvoyltetrahydropterin/6-carboxytetrahydropterin synthase